MNIARILYPVKVLGPGSRVGIWVAGCRRACPGCSNPELWMRRPEYEVPVPELLLVIKRLADERPVDGFTISGGEPMDQAAELSVLLAGLRELSTDILIYSGYTLEELRARDDEATRSVLTGTAVLIDGAYIEDRNDNSLLRGSSNQRIHILDTALEGAYREYLKNAKNRIQNFTTADGIVSVGIHRKGF